MVRWLSLVLLFFATASTQFNQRARAQDQARLKPPSAETFAAAKAQIAEVYRDSYAKAKSAEERRAVADLIFKDGQKLTDAADDRYAMFRVAADIAATAGDLELAITIVDHTAGLYSIDRPAWTDDLLDKIGDKPRASRDSRVLAGNLEQIAGEAARQDRFDMAVRIAQAAANAARAAGDRALVAEVQSRQQDLEQSARAFAELRPALEKLKADPVDPAANEAVGIFRCYRQGRWEDGLPKLALAADRDLAALAAKELAQPQAAADKAAVGDAWWERAEKDEAHRHALRCHAVDWYLRALGQLQGLAKRRIESRLEDSEAWLSKTAVYRASQSNRTSPPLPSFLTESERYHEGGYAFHIEGPGFVTIDLKREVPITRIHIQNRVVADRTRGMRMYFSNSPSQRGEQVWIAPDNAAEWNVRMPKLATARYITLVNEPAADSFFHLKKLKVYGLEAGKSP